MIAFALMGISAWALAQFADFKELVSADSLLLQAFCGLFIFLVAMLGCVGTLWMMKWALFTYSVLIFILTVLMAVASITILVFAGQVEASAVGGITDPLIGEMNAFVNCSFNKCCVPEADGTFNFGARAKVDIATAAVLRANEVPCTSTIGVAGAVCGVLFEMRVNTVESCAQFSKYESAMKSWIESNFANVGYVTIACSVIQCLAMFVACGMICTTDHSPKIDPYQAD
eukprot:g579.t1